MTGPSEAQVLLILNPSNNEAFKGIVRLTSKNEMAHMYNSLDLYQL